MLNKFLGIGRVCRDVDFRAYQTTNGEVTVARYTIAIDRKGKKDETDFISCVCFGKTAEFANKYLGKGMKIAVEGRIQTGKYEKDGATVYTTDVVVENHEFCESRKSTEDGGSRPSADDYINIPPDIAEEMPFGKH